MTSQRHKCVYIGQSYVIIKLKFKSKDYNIYIVIQHKKKMAQELL